MTTIQVYSEQERTEFEQCFNLPLIRFLTVGTWRFDAEAFRQHMEIAREITIDGCLVAWAASNYGAASGNVLTALINKQLPKISPDNSHCAAVAAGKRTSYQHRLEVLATCTVSHRPVRGYVYWPLAVTNQGYDDIGTTDKEPKKQTRKGWQIDHLPTGTRLVGGHLRTKRQGEALVAAIFDAHPQARDYLTNLVDVPSATVTGLANEIKQGIIKAAQETG